MRTAFWTSIVLGVVTLSAHAQLRLPGLPMPNLTTPLSTVGLTAATDVDARALERLSHLREDGIHRLLRDNRRSVEADPHGEPMLRGELVALSPTDAALERAQAAGFGILRQQALEGPDERLVVLAVPPQVSTAAALAQLHRLDPDGLYDFDHLYTHAGDDPVPTGLPHTGTAPSDVAHGAAPLRIGLIDTGIDGRHPAFASVHIHPWGCADVAVPAAHGTAVASLMEDGTGMDLYSADVYCGSPTGGAIDTLVAALAWMGRERVPVINISLVGPRNRLLERVVATLIGRGHLLVAAVGNDGPSAPPLFPAAYPHVVGVTGVDAKHRVLVEALRGPQVAFAAAGADIQAAVPGQGRGTVRGTSYASPVVAALLAHRLTTVDPATAQAAVDDLAAHALDLGPPGKDLTYGYGFVEPGMR